MFTSGEKKHAKDLSYNETMNKRTHHSSEFIPKVVLEVLA